ncbi:Regulatory protein Spx [Lactiplantibacillus plantarum]|nr:Regulatory protein Spx [Lactiplantibacillus plantarum]
MIKLFTQAGCNSSRKARQWFRDHNIAFEEKNFSSAAPTVSELKQILCLTENGLEDIISTVHKVIPQLLISCQICHSMRRSGCYANNPSCCGGQLLLVVINCK